MQCLCEIVILNFLVFILNFVLRMCSKWREYPGNYDIQCAMEGSSQHDIGELLNAQRGIESEKITERKVYSKRSVRYVKGCIMQNRLLKAAWWSPIGIPSLDGSTYTIFSASFTFMGIRLL